MSENQTERITIDGPLLKNDEFERRLDFVLSTTERYIGKISRKMVWEWLLDLRILGLGLIVVALIFKSRSILDRYEFSVTLLLGALLVFLGTYFNNRNAEGKTKILAENVKSMVGSPYVATTGNFSSREKN